ncbi:4Fe-4S binding protein [bacterium]|nr:4Fe-4S binding protein [bacterium]
MRELVVISGKGGTGKTSITASFAVLARGAVMADCDVDAADLHLLLQPRVRECHAFFSGRLAAIRKADCIACGACLAHCRFGAVSMNGPGAGEAVFTIDPAACEGCGVCARFCPVKAIDLSERRCGEWRVSETRCGTMVHAQLAAGAGNSGKLVSLVRDQARRIAGERGAPLVLADGPPGIGCPVIASLAGASLALIVTEPSVSGEHDLLRVLALARHFALPAAVCVNKWDVNPEMTERIERAASAAGARIGGRIRYDRAFTAAQLDARAVVEADAPAAEDIRRVWHALDAMEIRSELARRH